MHRLLIAAVPTVFIATLEVSSPIHANQDQPQALRAAIAEAGLPVPPDLRYRVLADGTILFDGVVGSADVHQQTLHALNPASKRITEVFPGTYTSTYGAQLLRRLDDLLTRVGATDRDALVAKKVSAGFDRAITSWRAHPAGQAVALAVHYSRGRLSEFEVEVSDDYGRSDPLDAADYEFFTVGACLRSGADAWTCDEEHLAVVAKKHNVALSSDRGSWDAAAEKLLELVLAK